MEKSRFVELAPSYYALGIGSYFKSGVYAHASKATIRREFHQHEESGSDPDDGYNYLQSDVLFDKGVNFLVERGMLTIIPDEFGPAIFSRLETFDEGWSALEKNPALPFYKYELDKDRANWLRSALSAVNDDWIRLKITKEDFDSPDSDWEPIPLDRADPKLQEITGVLAKTIEEVRADNGYSATVPEERAYVLDSLKETAEKLNKDNTISWGYIKKKAIEPLQTLMYRFGQASTGVLAQATKAAILDWLKSMGIKLLDGIWSNF